MRKMGARLKMLTVFMAVALVIATLGFATYAVSDNLFGNTGNTPVEPIQVFEPTDVDVNIVYTIGEAGTTNSDKIYTKELSLGSEEDTLDSRELIINKSYEIYIRLSVSDLIAEDLKVGDIVLTGGLSNYYDITEESSFQNGYSKNTGSLRLGNSFTQKFTLTPKFNNIESDVNVSYGFAVEVKNEGSVVWSGEYSGVAKILKISSNAKYDIEVTVYEYDKDGYIVTYLGGGIYVTVTMWEQFGDWGINESDYKENEFNFAFTELSGAEYFLSFNDFAFNPNKDYKIEVKIKQSATSPEELVVKNVVVEKPQNENSVSIDDYYVLTAPILNNSNGIYNFNCIMDANEFNPELNYNGEKLIFGFKIILA